MDSRICAWFSSHWKMVVEGKHIALKTLRSTCKARSCEPAAPQVSNKQTKLYTCRAHNITYTCAGATEGCRSSTHASVQVVYVLHFTVACSSEEYVNECGRCAVCQLFVSAHVFAAHPLHMSCTCYSGKVVCYAAGQQGTHIQSDYKYCRTGETG